MKTQIAIITTEFLREFVDDVFQEMPFDMEYTIYFYSNFRDVIEVYRALPDQIQAVITSGMVPYQIIRKSFPDTRKVVRSFNIDDGAIYRLVLALLNDNRSLDINRIYADLLDITGKTLPQYLFERSKVSYEDLLTQRIKDVSVERLINAEQFYMNKHLEFWQTGEIDISITRFSSIASALEEKGLQVYFPFPSYTYMEAVCASTLQDVEIQELKANQIASIVVSFVQEDNTVAHETSSFYRALVRLNTTYRLNALPRPIPQGYELLTKRSMVEEMTEQLTVCKIQTFFQKRSVERLYVGYGLGTDLYQARINAIDANREARQMAGSASALINEQDELICPLQKGSLLVISRNLSQKVSRAARKSGLSTMTIQKVAAAVESMSEGYVTSQNLAQVLSITQRSANRYLNALCRSGYAKIMDQKKSSTMGRPERIYTVHIEV